MSWGESMREIKFRGKRIDNSEWIYGDYYKKIIYKDSGKGQIIHYIGWQIKDKDGTRWNEYEAVDIETVGEYTGLHDKNGKEIYENDIVRDYDEGFLYHVLFGEYYAQFMFYDFVNDDYYDNRDIAEHEIIGNIHDNPELLEKDGHSWTSAEVEL